MRWSGEETSEQRTVERRPTGSKKKKDTDTIVIIFDPDTATWNTERMTRCKLSQWRDRERKAETVNSLSRKTLTENHGVLKTSRCQTWSNNHSQLPSVCCEISISCTPHLIWNPSTVEMDRVSQPSPQLCGLEDERAFTNDFYITCSSCHPNCFSLLGCAPNFRILATFAGPSSSHS